MRLERFTPEQRKQALATLGARFPTVRADLLDLLLKAPVDLSDKSAPDEAVFKMVGALVRGLEIQRSE